MAGTETKRIIELTEASTVQSGDFIAVDSNARGTKKVSTDALATSAALTAETNARAGADEQMSERMDGIEEQTALIQNPTKTVSGALCSFTDGADMPMVACTAEIVPKQDGTGTPSPDNVRPISGWESVKTNVSGKNLYSYDNLTSKNIYRATTVPIDNDPNSFYLAGAQGGMDNPQLLVASWGSTRTYYGLKFRENTTVRLTCTVKNYTPDCHGYIALCYKATNEGGDAGLTILSRTFFDAVGETEISLTGEIPADNYFVLSTSPASKSTDFTLSQYPEVRNMQLELGTTATAYEPYNGTTTTTPLGRTVYGGTLDVVSGVLTAYPFYPSYNGETLDGRWICDRAVYAEGTTPPTGSQVALISGTSTTYQLTPTQINTLLGENNVWADSGDVEITYRRDISIVLENLENALNGSNSLNAMMMSAPTENTAEEPTEDEAEDDMR